MASIVHTNYPAGLRRAEHARTPFSGTAVGALILVLRAMDSVRLAATARLREALHAWAQRRREREEDRQLWELALSDHRVMADLVALRQHADRS